MTPKPPVVHERRSSDPSLRDFRKFVNLSEFTDIWTKVLDLSLKGEDLNASEVFIKLMGLGTILRWKDSHQKTPIFIPDPRLHKIGNYIPSLKVNARLVDVLNKNLKLLDKVKIVKPTNIEVNLTGITRNLSPHNLLKKENLQIFLKYVQNPNVFLWEIYVRAALGESFNQGIHREKVRGLNYIMDLIAKETVDACKHEVQDLH